MLGALLLTTLPSDARRTWLLPTVRAKSADPPPEALLLPGKSTLYQRLLTRPGARLTAQPKATRSGAAIPPLSVLFVYERRVVKGVEWMEVGTAPRNKVIGWIEAAKTIPWRQTLTAAFLRASGHEPVLFFRNLEALDNLLESEQRVSEVRRLREQIAHGRLPEDAPVIASEPPLFVDPYKEFYLLPILDFKKIRVGGFPAKELRVAAVTLRKPDEGAGGHGATATGRPSRGDAASHFRAGVVFVIDSTSSMGPYIDRTREEVRRLYRRLRTSKMGDALSFGLVTYRDNTKVRPGLEYVSRVVADLDDGRSEERFFEKVSSVEPASVSSKDFREDALAGLYDAVYKIDWSGIQGRFLVLITDAGTRSGKDPLARDKFTIGVLRGLLQEQDRRAGQATVAVYALHLLTDEGRNNHEDAAEQYTELTTRRDAGALYFPIPGGQLGAFGAAVDQVADSILDIVGRIRSGKVVEVPVQTENNEIARKTALIGRTMQLAYLGRERGAKAPMLVDAWALDRDLLDSQLITIDVRALITKDQLSDLEEALRLIIDTYEETQDNPLDFFARLRSAAAALARDPDRVAQSQQIQTFADIGRVREWLRDLPYKSRLMNISQEQWEDGTYAFRQDVRDEIEGKLEAFVRIHNDTDRWVSLEGAAVRKGQAVTTIPLDQLP